MFYRSTVTGKIFFARSLEILNSIYGPGTMNEAIREGILQEIPEPSVVECLRYGTYAMAAMRYKELHPECSDLKDARKAVRQIRRDMERIRYKNK